MNKIIGVTGRIGSGKSTICNLLLERLKYSDDQYIDYSDLVEEFYKIPSIIDNLNTNFRVKTKDEISELNLTSVELFKLSKIFAPYIEGYLLALDGNYIVELPLLFETSLEHLCYRTINVDTEYKYRSTRVSNKQFNKLNNLQLSNNIRNKKSDFVIFNDGNMTITINQLSFLINSLGL